MKKFFVFALALLSLLATKPASALSLDWGGGYRIEYTEVDSPTLGATESGKKSYGQHLLYLTPTIIPADGFLINTRLDVLTNNDPAYQNSQQGMFFGRASIPTGQNGEGTVYRQDMGGSNVLVTQAYLTYTDEMATLKAGRMPYQFGLGINYNAGAGMFDHWYDTYDMVSYKVMVGSVSVTPMIGEMYQQQASMANKYQVQMLELRYDNPDTGSTLGLLFERRNAGTTVVSSDNSTAATFFGGTSGKAVADYSMNQTSFFLDREWKEYGFKLEGDFQQGSTGIMRGTDTVRINAYGIATEFTYRPEESRWNTNFRLGIASGDDPSSTDNYEGFLFDRNYDVAFLLFNQRMGNSNTDFFRTNLIKDTTTSRSYFTAADDETISNTTYISPRISYAYSDKLDIVNTFTYAQLMNKYSSTVDIAKDLGLEWDIEFVYKPREKVRWVNEIGLLFPGSAWTGGRTNKFSNDSTYGLSSKAAISF